jgi:hypothetical protein
MDRKVQINGYDFKGISEWRGNGRIEKGCPEIKVV